MTDARVLSEAVETLHAPASPAALLSEALEILRTDGNNVSKANILNASLDLMQTGVVSVQLQAVEADVLRSVRLRRPTIPWTVPRFVTTP